MPYISFGSGKETIVILPGVSPYPIAPLGESIADAYSSFSAKYRVLLFDRRKNLPDGCSLTELAEDTVESIHHLGISNCHIYGVSQGGMIAILIAAAYPSLVKKLCVCSTALSLNDNAVRIIANWDKLAASNQVNDLFISFAESIYGSDTLNRFPALLCGPFTALSVDDLTSFRRQLTALHTPSSLSDYLSQIQCPVFAIASSGDRIFPAENAEKIAFGTGGHHHIYSSIYGHAVYDEAPDIKDRILAFFNSNQ